MSGKGDVKAQKKRYRAKHREELNEKQKIYGKTYREKIKNNIITCDICGLCIKQGDKSSHMKRHKP